MRLSSAHIIIQRVLDLLFPPPKRVQRIRSLSAADINRLGGNKQPEKAFIAAICDYTDRSVQDVVQAAKYDKSRKALELMGEILAEALPAICEEKRIFANRIVIIPIPLSDNRRYKRGFNQCVKLTRLIEKQDSGNTFESRQVLEKVRETPAQTHLSKQQRKQNLAGCFRVKPGVDIPEDIIIVIDDVTTTGATLTEARRALKKQTDARILGVAFAH